MFCRLLYLFKKWRTGGKISGTFHDQPIFYYKNIIAFSRLKSNNIVTKVYNNNGQKKTINDRC
jgi:hypothetical protein